MNYEHLGQRIREERLKHNLTQSKLAEDVNISDSYLGYIERGERSLSLETLVNLANRLGVTVDYLLHDSISPSDETIVDQSDAEKQMAIDVLKTMFSYLDHE